MEVRVCPKCGTQNRKSFLSCSSCRASLANVPVTDGTDQQATVQIPPAAAPAPPRPTGPPMAGDRPPMDYRSAPVQMGPGPMPIVIAVIVIAAVIGLAAFIGYRNNHPAPPLVTADTVVKNYLEARKARKLDKVKPYLSAASVDMIKNAFSTKQAESAGFTQKDAENMFLYDVDVNGQPRQTEILKVEVIKDEDLRPDLQTCVQVTLRPILPAIPGASNVPNAPNMPDLSKLDFTETEDYVLINEGAKWKIDLSLTMRHKVRAFRGGKGLGFGGK